VKMYYIKLVTNDDVVIRECSLMSKTLKYAKQYAWNKWDFSLVEGNRVFLMWDNVCLSRRVRQSVWISETKKGN